MRKLLKKSAIFIIFALASIIFQISVLSYNSDGYNIYSSTYSGIFYLSGNHNSSVYININSSDTIMHCVFYKHNGAGNTYLLTASNADAIVFSPAQLSVHYPNNNYECYKSGLDGSNYGYFYGEVNIMTTDIDLSPSLTINYLSYPYLK
ncbi:MAG: hypothetical protein II820_10825 [Ruminiclostridium sp.]|nr:hypothetical protein [Ruminiclostridium sp.]